MKVPYKYGQSIYEFASIFKPNSHCLIEIVLFRGLLIKSVNINDYCLNYL